MFEKNELDAPSIIVMIKLFKKPEFLVFQMNVFITTLIDNMSTIFNDRTLFFWIFVSGKYNRKRKKLYIKNDRVMKQTVWLDANT
jgi:hypothetical protein